jgi:hypothetical protein
LRASKCVALAIVGAIVLASGTGVSAHRLDEFLQAARIAIEPNRVSLELSLTPGIAVAERVVRDIDVNGDGTLSSTEQLEYAAHVLSGVTLRIDSSLPFRLKPGRSSFPDIDALRSGDGVIQIESEAEVPALAPGVHHLVFRNDNSSKESVYLANALQPGKGIAVTQQARDVDQRELRVEFTARPSSGQWIWIGLAGLLILVSARTPIRAPGSPGTTERE